MNDSRNDAPARSKLIWVSGAFVGLLFLAIVALAAVPSAVSALGGHGRGHDFMQWKMEKLLERIDASDEQKARISAIVEQRSEVLHGFRDDKRQLHDSAVALLTADTIDRAAIEAMRAEQVERLNAASRELADGIAEIAEVLTPEQRSELAEWASKHHERRGHRGHGEDGGRGHRGGWHR